MTDDISDLTCAALFNKVGNTAPLTIRFSTVGGESGSADTARDPRGMSSNQLRPISSFVGYQEEERVAYECLLLNRFRH